MPPPLPLHGLRCSFGILPGSLYHHFASKRDMYKGLLVDIGTELEDLISKAAAQASGTPVEAALLIGSRVAFLGAGAVWTLAIIATLFIRAPELSGDEPTMHH